MTVRLRQRQKKYLVRKHVAYGRTYNYVDNDGYDHYTKGHRKSTLTTERVTNGNKFLNAFIERAFPKPVAETSVVNTSTDDVKDTGDVV